MKIDTESKGNQIRRKTKNCPTSGSTRHGQAAGFWPLKPQTKNEYLSFIVPLVRAG
jgi:hypothetical protein